MVNITVLSEDILKRLCIVVSAKSIKHFYQQNPSEFSKIKPGYRPNMISDEEAITLAVRQVKQDFMFRFLTEQAEKISKNIQEQSGIESSETIDQNQALAYAIFESPLSKDPDLYFILAGEATDEEKKKAVKQHIKTIKESKRADVETAMINMENTLNNQEKGKISQEAENKTYEQEIELLQAKIQDLNSQLIEAENRKAREQSILAKYDDSQSENIFIWDDYTYNSICEISIDYSGQIWLIRLADIDRKGYIEKFVCNEELPRIFENRTRLFHKDGPTDEGFIGVWSWKASLNKNDSSKDYIESAYNDRIELIEIIVLPESKSIQEVVSVLKEGITLNTFPGRKIFAFYANKSQYIGIGCNENDLETVVSDDTIMRLKPTVIALPEYEFNGKNIVKLTNGTILYRYLSIGMPSGIVNVKDPLEVVKDVILSRTTWNIYKQAGRTRSEWKIARDFISQVDVTSIINEIAETCFCSKEEANSYYEEFIRNIDCYIDGGSIEDSVISAVISKNNTLLERCKMLITDEWRKENALMIEVEEKKLSEIQQKINMQRDEYESQKTIMVIETQRLQDQRDALSAEIQEALCKLQEKEQMAEAVEKSVADRISKAKQNAADFIASMAFVSPSSTVIPLNKECSTAQEGIRYISGEGLDPDELEACPTVEAMLETIAYELISAGVIKKYARPLAAYLHAADITHISLLLIGPNSKEIVDAYSAALCGKKAGHLNCDGNYDPLAIEKCLQTDDHVVCVTNIFDNHWITRVSEITNDEHFFAFTYPYIEDIQIEPRSIYNYMLPIYTELFIDGAPGGEIIGGRRTEEYKEFTPVRPVNKYMSIMKELHIAPLICNNLHLVIANMQSMLKDMDFDNAVVFSLMPYAFATLQQTKLLQLLEEVENTSMKASKELMSELKYLVGIENE